MFVLKAMVATPDCNGKPFEKKSKFLQLENSDRRKLVF